MESGCRPSPRQCGQFSSQRAASQLTQRRDGAGSTGSKGHSLPTGRCFSQGGLNRRRQVSWKLTFLSHRRGLGAQPGRSHACPLAASPHPSAGACPPRSGATAGLPLPLVCWVSESCLQRRARGTLPGLPVRLPAGGTHCDGHRDKAESVDVTHQYFLESGSPSSLRCLGR